jgi:hypothetical protein
MSERLIKTDSLSKTEGEGTRITLFNVGHDEPIWEDNTFRRVNHSSGHLRELNDGLRVNAMGLMHSGILGKLILRKKNGFPVYIWLYQPVPKGFRLIQHTLKWPDWWDSYWGVGKEGPFLFLTFFFRSSKKSENEP